MKTQVNPFGKEILDCYVYADKLLDEGDFAGHLRWRMIGHIQQILTQLYKDNHREWWSDSKPINHILKRRRMHSGLIALDNDSWVVAIAFCNRVLEAYLRKPAPGEARYDPLRARTTVIGAAMERREFMDKDSFHFMAIRLWNSYTRKEERSKFAKEMAVALADAISRR